MLAIKKARKLIEANPADVASQTLAELVLALENEVPFPLVELYQLDQKHFEIALEILAEWRMDRHYAKKLRLMDASALASGMESLTQSVAVQLPASVALAGQQEEPVSGRIRDNPPA